ncbi:transglycosylase domain-containing protein [Cellvibrio sp. ARAG 10.3]|uniref:transglycosylase domain-containing protein n=1 Tax=Cellvibrio sp. ARAG 10.3 TaxID=3451358 RepID=UPI003F44E08A
MRSDVQYRYAETVIRKPPFVYPYHPKPAEPPVSRGTGRRRWRWLLIPIVFCLGLAGLAWYEARTSWLQARWLPDYARSLSFALAEGPSDSIRFPVEGPFDQRLGYANLPAMLDNLQANGFYIDRQVRFSPPLLTYVDSGFYPPYREKNRAGLTVRDANQQIMFNFRYPRHVFKRFEEIPPLMIESLLFIEDRRLLSENRRHMNPTVNWGRFLKAAVFKMGEAINLDTPSMGGSTLATQIEKFRHSKEGITSSVEEKLRQMVSSSVRVYQQGVDTMPARRQLVLDYLNTVPLAAAPGYGEVNGIGDGFNVWFAADPTEVNRLLALKQPEAEELQLQGMALRQLLALMIAHRRPSYYLLQDRKALGELVDAHLRLLQAAHRISPALAKAGLEQSLEFRNFREQPAVVPAITNKGVNVVRNRLVNLLDVSLYQLDRMDLEVTTTLDRDLQEQVTSHLRSLRDPAVAATQGLVGEYLLRPGQAENLYYSFTLFERGALGNEVLVQTDNTNIPFNINEGSKLELGSTAKLRVLASYLEIIAELHQRYSSSSPEAEVRQDDSERDPLTRWVLTQLSNQPDMALEQMLAEALNRRYSAHTNESFFTGGGKHTFSNFRREDNNRNPTVREALNESINLPFVRMLRDVISYITHQQWQDLQAVMRNDDDPRRRDVLARFADREGTQFLSQFWSKYAHKGQEERVDAFLSGLQLTPVRAAVIHRYLYPTADLDSFSHFMTTQLPQPLTAETLARLYDRYTSDLHNLQDLGYLARVHPLELWLVGYLLQHGNPGFSEVVNASADTRQEVYRWLSRTRASTARDSRIRTMLEVEAFAELHERWRRLGFPFDHLVPSLATALGSSGDRPAALAELMGIIMNDGERIPPRRISRLVFAADTPYETRLSHPPAPSEEVMRPEVAQAMKLALGDVVTQGTGRRLRGAYEQFDGSELKMGGKTGTGDNRLVSTGGGQRITGRALSRTATLVFYLGENHFGTLTAFVIGDEAGQYRFTSALPTQVLKGMAPIIEPYVQRAALLETPYPFEYQLDATDLL